MSDMDPVDNRGEFADKYDALARNSEAFGGDVLFGMMYEFIRPGDRLIDLGIGTGLASQPFYRAGVRITGIDISAPMLDRCRAKEIADILQVQDLREALPFEDGEFSHAIAVGVLHFIRDLDVPFREASRVLMPGGIFGFTTFCPEDESKDISVQQVHGSQVYQHSNRLVQSLTGRHQFQMLKTIRFAYYSDPSKTLQVTNRIYVFRRLS